MDTSPLPMGPLFSRVIIVFSMTIFGVIARKCGFIKEEASSSFSETVIYLTIPCLIFTSVAGELEWQRLIGGFLAPVLAIGVTLVAIGLALGYAGAAKIDSRLRGTFVALSAIPNAGFVGFPVVYAILGKVGLAYAALFDLGLNLVLWSVVVGILGDGSGRREGWKHLSNPAICAILLAMLLSGLKIRLPEQVMEPLRIVGNATIPMAMLLIGYTFAGLQFKKLFLQFQVFAVCILKLIFCPIIAFLIMLPFPLDPVIRSVAIVISAMPSMASTTVLTYKFGGDPEFSTAGIFVSSIISLITIPIMVSVLA